MNEIYLGLSIAGLFIFCIPTFNYWMKILNEEYFENGRELFCFTIFEMLFNASALNIVFYTFLHYTISAPSFFLFFLFTHGCLFTCCTIAPAISYFVIWIWKQIKRVVYKKASGRFTFKLLHKLTRFMSKKFGKYYYDYFGTIEIPMLSGKIIGIVLITAYLICGIFSVSDISNTFIIKYMHVTFSKNADVKNAYDRDLQLYSELFIISLFPILISNAFRKSGPDKKS